MANVRKGYGFYGGRSTANARLLLGAAEELGIPAWEIATTRDGYIVPNAVLDKVNPTEKVEEVEEEVTEAVKRPGKNDSKADWAAYVESLGVDIPEGTTKDDLFALADEAEKERN
jgi:hypothetical protein